LEILGQSNGSDDIFHHEAHANVDIAGQIGGFSNPALFFQSCTEIQEFLLLNNLFNFNDRQWEVEISKTICFV
jgi:hypothetical protein